jgi:AAA domain/DnaB-like helicase N terminal domain
VNNDVEIAQDAVLGIVLNHPAEAARIFGTVPVGSFDGRRRFIAEAIQGLRIRREPIDMTTVSIELMKRGTTSRVGAAEVARLASGYMASHPSLDFYLDVIVRHNRLAALEAIGTRLVQYTGATDADPLEIAQIARQQAQAIIDAGEADADVDTMTLDEFLAVEEAPYDWVIPDLLERADRLILTGGEGLGKSTLFRQIAVMVAAGLHPFTGKPIPQQRILYVDCENGPSHMRRKLRPLATQARLRGQGAGQTLFIEGRPEGLDLTDPAGQQWLVARVAALQPAALFTGSLYKLFEGDPNKEEPARAVSAVLDRCRAVANCAIVIEAHSGHSSNQAGERHVRPIGASLWLRWPEFGYGLRPTKDFDKNTRVVDFVGWRGDRDERAWPRRLKAGSVWPWEQATYDPYNDAAVA